MFQFSKRSDIELAGVHEHLARVVRRALELSAVDFAVHDGKRTLEEQQKLVEAGASKTLDSRHLTGHAVDLVPVVNGKLRWEWMPIYTVIGAVRLAATEFQVPLRWGGVWDRRLADLPESLEDAVAAYVARRKKLKLAAFLDGPHIELPKEVYL